MPYYDGPRRSGRFLKKGSKVCDTVSLLDFSFGEGGHMLDMANALHHQRREQEAERIRHKCDGTGESCNGDAGQRRLDPLALQFAMEPLGRFVATEVGLMRESFDRLAAHPERRPLAADVETGAGHRIDAVHHHAGRLSRIREGLGVREQVGQRVTQRGDPLAPLAPRRRDRQHGEAQIAERGDQHGRARLRLGSIQLVEGDERGLLEQRRVVRRQLRADDLGIAYRVGGGGIDHVDEHARARGVSQEGEAQSGADRGPLDEPGDVRDRVLEHLRLTAVANEANAIVNQVVDLMTGGGA